MVWGSDDVLREFIAYRRFIVNRAEDQPAEVLFAYENLVATIRSDLGHKNKDLKRGDVLSLFINDIDQYL